ncbi:MAG TPA: tagaturonate epimerase family protein [Ignavibacteriaceae bacterium]|nr:tagaturonate epimerase family protein [Ignavibacteriaceae bacterium]
MNSESVQEEAKINLLDNHSTLIEYMYRYGVEIYPNSIKQVNSNLFLMGKEGIIKYLYLISEGDFTLQEKYRGEVINKDNGNNLVVKRCELSTENRKSLQEQFDFTVPKVLGLCNSFGFGDRIGLANAGHIRSLQGSDFKAILAQQSIRELTRTNRKPEEVMNAAVWAVFQEGYEDGFGADADHLKTTEDIDLMVNAGFTMFTFDPGEYVVNEADSISEEMLEKKIDLVDWQTLNGDYQLLQSSYVRDEIKIAEDFSLSPTTIDLKRAVVKYGNAIAHIKKMYDYLKSIYPNYNSEVEISVDETDTVTSPFEHFFIAGELKRLGVELASLAPRFVGAFEKGIDYRGDLDLFKTEYIKHLDIVKYYGSYKISLHSGSDKFSVYKVIGTLKEAFTHVKTAGTSYLEALKVTALKNPTLFKEILDFSRSIYESEKQTYHVSADLNSLKPSSEYRDIELVRLFEDDDCRQILHVCFGRVLTDRNEDGSFKFKEKIVSCLEENESTHYEILINHFNKHLDPFKQL